MPGCQPRANFPNGHWPLLLLLLLLLVLLHVTARTLHFSVVSLCVVGLNSPRIAVCVCARVRVLLFLLIPSSSWYFFLFLVAPRWSVGLLGWACCCSAAVLPSR